MVLGSFEGLTDFGGNYDFGVVLYFQLFCLFSCYGWALYGIFDLQGLHSSATVL